MMTFGSSACRRKEKSVDSEIQIGFKKRLNQSYN